LVFFRSLLESMNGDMRGKVVAITGATSGIGQVAAETLARKGARIVQVARSNERAEASLSRLRECAPSLRHAVYYADLSRISEMKRVASEIAAAEPRMDVLINNAGGMFSRRRISEDGLELTFAVNHLAYFVVTTSLMHRLISSAPARIVNTSSDAHESATLEFDDLQSDRAYRERSLLEWARFGGPGFKVYARSKLCNILFTQELSRRLDGTGVTANCFHPGFVATRFGDDAGGLISFSIRIGKHFALSAEEGARTLVYLASSPDVANMSGKYFYKCQPVQPSREAQDHVTALRLWEESQKLANSRD
jgi:NAD(P)-dependent dehydrogenase (short-subunit alcohol dehydrogenase family)